MTRAKEITKEAKKFAKEIDDWEIAEDVQDAFEQGAQWADAHPHWISVEDELPPRFPLSPNDSMNVITYGLHTMVNWYDYGRGEWVIDSEITHWMPLPQPPKKGGEK